MKFVQGLVGIVLVNAVFFIVLVSFMPQMLPAEEITLDSFPTSIPSPIPTTHEVKPVVNIVKRVVLPASTSSVSTPVSTIFPPAATSSEIANDSAPPPPTSVPQVVQPTPDNRCIIGIDGTSYDVTVFRSIHGGGDVFKCGADMSTAFHDQHPNSFLDKMQKYRI